MTARDNRVITVTDQHEVLIYDEDAKALAHLYLPPDGTQISGPDLATAVSRLAAAASERKRLRGEGDDGINLSRSKEGRA